MTSRSPDDVWDVLMALNTHTQSLVFRVERMTEKIEALEEKVKKLTSAVVVIFAMNEKAAEHLETIEAYTESLVTSNDPPPIVRSTLPPQESTSPKSQKPARPAA